MSTSILYHSFGIYGYRYVSTQYRDGAIIFTIDKDPLSLRCPGCKSGQVIRRGGQLRWFHTLPIGRKQTYIKLDIPRVFCRLCGLVRQINIGFADARYTYAKSFERYAMQLSHYMTIQDVARHLGTGWDMIKEIQRRYLTKRYSHPKLKALELIAIDEISIGKGHNYLTVVLDLVSGAIIFVGNGKGVDALVPFWKRLKCSRAKIQAVAIDMSPAYVSTISKNLPKATIVFDHFHLIKLFNEKLSDFRRALHRQATEEGKKVLRGLRWLLLKNPENLKSQYNEKQRLEQALLLNSSLATVYYLKEDLRQLWFKENKKQAAVHLDDWIARAKSSSIKMLLTFSETLEKHRDGILAYFDFPISTGPLEGTNNKIKTLQKQAYGFRDMEFFKLKILGLHETKYALTG